MPGRRQRKWTPTPEFEEYDLEEARVVAWFVTGLRHEAIRLAKKHRRLEQHELLVLDRQLQADAADEVREMVDTLPAKADTLAEVEDRLFVQEALSLLTPRQRQVVMATILEGRPEREVAAKMGMSQQAVNRLKERALNRLRKHFSDQALA